MLGLSKSMGGKPEYYMEREMGRVVDMVLEAQGSFWFACLVASVFSVQQEARPAKNEEDKEDLGI